MTNSGPAPRFDDANHHFQEIHYKHLLPIDHISVGLGETTWALKVGTSGTSRLIFAFNFSTVDTSSCTWYKLQCNFLSSFHYFLVLQILYVYNSIYGGDLSSPRA
jgi:hypothetical protein